MAAKRPRSNLPLSERITLTPRETMEFTGFGVDRTYKLLNDGIMPSMRIGRLFYVPRVALIKWLESAGKVST